MAGKHYFQKAIFRFTGFTHENHVYVVEGGFLCDLDNLYVVKTDVQNKNLFWLLFEPLSVLFAKRKR